jgi:hypothetical protein
VCQIIHVIWNDAKFWDLRERATGILLSAVTSERYDDYSLILGVIARVFQRRWWIADYVRGWARGHFLKVS